MTSFPDWFWPNNHGTTEPYPEDLPLIAHAPTAERLDFIERELREADARESARDQSVQSRLTALLGLSSTLRSLTTALLGLALTSSRIDLTRAQLTAVVVSLSYLAVQFVAAMFYTASGLLPRGIEVIKPGALDPNPGESALDFRRDILSTHRSNLGKTMWATNRRMDEMRYAILAMRNASRGVAVLFAVGVVIVLNRWFGICLRSV